MEEKYKGGIRGLMSKGDPVIEEIIKPLLGIENKICKRCNDTGRITIYDNFRIFIIQSYKCECRL